MTHQGDDDEAAAEGMIKEKYSLRQGIFSNDLSYLEIDVETLELPPLPEHIQALLTPKYRLVINKIEINNFKSFAGRIQLDQFDEVCQVILPFQLSSSLLSTSISHAS